MTRTSTRHLLCVVISFLVALLANAQSEINFTNKVAFTKTGNLNGVRLVTLIPAPVTNEYQEISSLQANRGRFVDLNEANKLLFYDGPFEDNILEVFESFKYKTKPVCIDFANKSNKNIVTGVDPNLFLGSDGSFVDTNNQTIKNIGDELWSVSSDKLDYAKRCYEYIASHFSYINGSWRYLTEILRIGGGECGDFTTLYVNLLRYKGIPARHNMGVWVNGGYHVWPDFYHEDYGWVPVDPTFKNSNPNGDYFGRYDGNLIILSQGLTTFSESGISIGNAPLQTYYYWYWYNSGSGNINSVHKTSKDYQVGINEVDADEPTSVLWSKEETIYNLAGQRLPKLQKGINIIRGRKIVVK